MILQEFNFTLPQGLLDDEGQLHRQGKMRLATGKDELLVQKDPRIQDNPDYHILLNLSRVILNLGKLSKITPEQLEQLFLKDLLYLKELYLQINQLQGDWLTSGE